MKVIDLYSGLGGFSQAFLDRGHEVIRYDNNERFKDVPNTVIVDVWDLTADDLRGADVILASPPCTNFSVAGLRFHWPGGRPTEKTLEQIELVKHTVRIITEANPDYWVLENPRGMMRRVLGTPVITTYWNAWGAPYLKPTDLWGKIPALDWPKPCCWEKSPRGGTTGLQGIRDPAKRSLIPYAFSEALCVAIENDKGKQTSLGDYGEW